MTDQARTREPRKGYSYSWYLPAVQPKDQVAAPPTQTMDAQFMEVTEDADSGLQLLNPEHLEITEPIPLVKPSRRMRKQSYGKHGILDNRLRLVAVTGWSSVSAMGALALTLSRPGQVPSLQLGELAATWAGLSALLWVLTSKISK